MAWFGFGKKNTTTGGDSFQQAADALLEFAVLAMSGVDPSAVERHPRKQKTIFAFHFGAIAELASHHNLDETQQLALAVRYLAHGYGSDAAETGSVTAIAAEIQNIEWRSACNAGAEAIRAWRTDNDRSASTRLAALLTDNQFIIHP